MCLRTYDPSIKVAKNNIPCYKFGEVIGTHFHPGFRQFYYVKYKRTKNVDLKSKKESVYDTDFVVNEGYHTFTTMEGCKRWIGLDTLGLFIIPKGSNYIDGNFDGARSTLNRVSSSLIYLGQDAKWNRWIAKIFYGVNFDK